MKSLSYKEILEKKDFLPFFVYDYETIKGQILKLRKYLPSNVKVYYSVKANPNIAILRIMKKFGLGAEIVSWGEFMAAKKAGFSGKEIICAGSTKSSEELDLAVENGIGLISVESESEIRRLEAVARSSGKKQKILMRLNLAGNGVVGNLKARVVSDFGISLRDAKKVFPGFFRNFPNLELAGLHFYEASRVFGVENLISRVREIFDLVAALEKEFKLDFEFLDIGGGFGSDMRNDFPGASFAKELSRLVVSRGLNRKKIILELGRYLVSRSGSFYTRVIEVRKNPGARFIVTQGLVNYLVKIFGRAGESRRFLGDIREYEVRVLPPRRGKNFPSVICGQMSSGADTFGRGLNCKFLLPEAKAGDVVIIKGVGAYGLTLAMTSYCSRPMAAEFLLIDGKLELIRDKGRPEDFLRHQIVPKSLQ